MSGLTLKEYQIIDKLEKYSKYFNDNRPLYYIQNEYAMNGQNFSISKYIKIIKYFEKIVNIMEINQSVRDYASYCLETIKNLENFKQFDIQYNRYKKLQNLKKQYDMNVTQTQN